MSFVREIDSGITVLHQGSVFRERITRGRSSMIPMSSVSISERAMSETLLEVGDLRASYGAGDILQGITFAWRGRDRRDRRPRTGFGKTTLMKALIGLLPTRAGAIRFRGRGDFAAGRRGSCPARSRLCAPGQADLPRSLGRGEPQARRAGERRRCRATISWFFELFPWLRERLQQKGGTLSGGEQQALAIGRALVGRPDCSSWTSRRRAFSRASSRRSAPPSGGSTSSSASRSSASSRTSA